MNEALRYDYEYEENCTLQTKHENYENNFHRVLCNLSVPGNEKYFFFLE